MKLLLLAVGNRWRRDDGAAHRALELVEPRPGVTARGVLQLTPEMAEEIAPFDRVVFLDADIEPGAPRITPVDADPAARFSLGHSIPPAELLALARKLYGFRGWAWLCRIPGVDFSEGEGLSETAELNAAEASRLLLGVTAA